MYTYVNVANGYHLTVANDIHDVTPGSPGSTLSYELELQKIAGVYTTVAFFNHIWQVESCTRAFKANIWWNTGDEPGVPAVRVDKGQAGKPAICTGQNQTGQTRVEYKTTGTYQVTVRERNPSNDSYISPGETGLSGWHGTLETDLTNFSQAVTSGATGSMRHDARLWEYVDDSINNAHDRYWKVAERREIWTLSSPGC
jgi:hypothetical protein